MPARPSLGSHRVTSLDPQLLWGLPPRAHSPTGSPMRISCAGPGALPWATPAGTSRRALLRLPRPAPAACHLHPQGSQLRGRVASPPGAGTAWQLTPSMSMVCPVSLPHLATTLDFLTQRVPAERCPCAFSFVLPPQPLPWLPPPSSPCLLADPSLTKLQTGSAEPSEAPSLGLSSRAQFWQESHHVCLAKIPHWYLATSPLPLPLVRSDNPACRQHGHHQHSLDRPSPARTLLPVCESPFPCCPRAEPRLSPRLCSAAAVVLCPSPRPQSSLPYPSVCTVFPSHCGTTLFLILLRPSWLAQGVHDSGCLLSTRACSVLRYVPLAPPFPLLSAAGLPLLPSRLGGPTAGRPPRSRSRHRTSSFTWQTLLSPCYVPGTCGCGVNSTVLPGAQH